MKGEFARLDVHFDEHPKYDDLGAATMGLIACAITRANRMRSDGRIARAWPERRFGRDGKAAAMELVRRGIWRVRDDGDYEIVGYLEHNRSRAEIEANRTAMAELGRKGGEKRAAKRDAYRDASPDDKRDANRDAEAQRQAVRQASRQAPRQADPDPDPDPEGLSQDRSVCRPSDTLSAALEFETPSETRIIRELPRNAAEDGAFGGAVAAWCEGIRSVTGKMFLAPPGGSSELAKLVMAITESCPDMGKRIEWARENAIAFAKWSLERLTAINVHRFVDWLNSPHAPSRQDAPGPSIATATTREERVEQIKREEAEQDARYAETRKGAGPPPEPLSAMMAKFRAGVAGGKGHP